MARRKLEYRAFDFDFRSFADVTIAILSFLYVIVLSLIIASFVTVETRTSFQNTHMAENLIGLIIMVLYGIDRVWHPDPQDNLWRSLMTFSALAPVSFINCLMLIIRVVPVSDGSLLSDFAGVPAGQVAAVCVVLASCFATIIAFVGLWVAHYEQRPFGLGSLGGAKSGRPKIVHLGPISPRRPSSLYPVPLYEGPNNQLSKADYPNLPPLPEGAHEKWSTIAV